MKLLSAKDLEVSELERIVFAEDFLSEGRIEKNYTSDFDEQDHPREEDGKFAPKGGGDSDSGESSNAKSDDAIRSSLDALDVLGDYVVKGHIGINTYLRNGDLGIPIHSTDEKIRDRKQILNNKIKKLDSLMKPISKPLVVERVFRGSIQWNSIFEHDKGFVSVFENLDAADRWAYSGLEKEGSHIESALIASIQVPKGVRAIKVRELGSAYEQDELILERGLHFRKIREFTEERIHPKDRNKPSWLGPKRIQKVHRVEIEVIPSKQHKSYEEGEVRGYSGDFDESEHPREDDGKFAPKGSGESSSNAKSEDAIRAVGTGKERTFVNADGSPVDEVTQARINALGIPPAWTGVQVSADPI